MPLVQRSFLGGIVSGALWALTSLAKRAYGLRDCVNFFVMANGGVCNRPGSAHIAGTKYNQRARYVTFAFGGDDGVALEMGNKYIRFDIGGEQFTVSTSDAPAYSGATAYILGDLASSGGVIYYYRGIGLVTGQAPVVTGPWLVEFIGALGYADRTTMTIDSSGLVGGTYTATVITAGSATENEVQLISTSAGAVVGGVFKITFEGQQTANIAWNASPATVQAALEALSNVGVNEAIVTAQDTFWYPLTMLSATVGIYEIPTPYSDLDAFDLDYDGYADVMFFSGGGETLYQLKRVTATKWTMRLADFVPSIRGPTNIAATTASGGGAVTSRYKVVAIKKNTEERSFPGPAGLVYKGFVDNTGAGGVLQVTAANTLAVSDDVVVIGATTVGARSLAFENAVLNRRFSVAAVTGADFDLQATNGITAPVSPNQYQLEVMPFEIAGVDQFPFGNVTAGNGFGGGTDGNIVIVVNAGVLPAIGEELLCVAVNPANAADPIIIDAMRAGLVGKTWRVIPVDATHFAIADSEHIVVPSAGNMVGLYFAVTALTQAGASGSDNTLTWNAVPEAKEYWIYRQLNGVFGYIGKTATLTFVDVITGTNYDTPAAVNDTPPNYFNPTNNGKPAAVALMKQRLVIAGGDDTPVEVQFSRSGDVLNYTQHVPIADADSFAYNVQGRLVESIQHLVALRQLIVLTAGDGWAVSGDRDGQIRAGGVSMDPEAFVGAARVTPVRVGTGCVFVDRVQSRLHEILYGADAGGYVAIDRSEHAPHLVMRKTVADIAYQQSPDSIVFATCDGTLLGLTLISRLDIAAWHRHTTGASGEYESVCVVPAVGGPRVHVIVKRTVNGSTVRHKERFALRDFGAEDYDIDADPFFVDDGVAFDGNADGITKLAITDTTAPFDYASGHTLEVTATLVPAGTTMFSSWDVGNRLVIVSGANSRTITITQYVSATVVRGTCTQAIPAPLQATALLTWTRYYHKLGGLSHLEAVPVAVFGDGTDDTVQATALHTVASGVATFTGYYVVGCVGIPIDASFETIGADVGGASFATSSAKGVTPEVTLLVQQSLGWKAGPAGGTLGAHTPTADDLEDDGMENRWRTVSVNTRAGIHAGGFTVSQKAPFPCAVMAAVADVKFGGGGAGP